MTPRDALFPQAVPIPADVRPGKGWTGQMLEMASHIGAHATLSIVDRFGGQRIYVPMDPSTNPFRDLVGAERAATLSHVYGREHLDIPVGRLALSVARRAHIIARVRAKELSVNAAAGMLRTSRTYLAQLIHHSDEGRGVDTDTPARPHDPRQMSLFGD